MGALTDDMKRVVERQRLGFVATVSADGAPNLSPKGTLCVLDDDHLMFADIRSPGIEHAGRAITLATVRRHNSSSSECESAPRAELRYSTMRRPA